MRALRGFVLFGIVVLWAMAPAASAQNWGWTRAYAGGEVGYGRAMGDLQTSVSGSGYFAASSVTAINDIGLQEVNSDAFTGGGFVGVHFLQAGPIVVGGELSFAAIAEEESTSTTMEYPCCAGTEFTLTQTVGPEWIATLRSRAGADLGPAFVYGTGGFALSGMPSSETFTDTFADASQSGEIRNTPGWVFGGGVEVDLFGPASIRGEFLNHIFPEASATSTNLTLSGGSSTVPDRVFTHTSAVTYRSVRLGVLFEF